MKQILYFFTGVFISFIFLTEAYAIYLLDIPPADLVDPGYPRSYQLYVDRAAAVAARVAGTYNVYTEKGYSWGGYQCGWDTPTTGDTLVFFMWGVDEPPPLDTDGDGFPDEIDMYPNDPNPYQIKLTSYQTADGTGIGLHSYEQYITDRGDYFSIGVLDDDNKTYLKFGSEWESPTGDLGSVTPVGSPNVPELPPYTIGIPTGDAPKDSDPDLKPGVASTGSETDNEALRGTMDNTADIASNTKRNGEYLKALNAAIQNMDRNISIQTFDNTGTDTDTDTSEADNEKSEEGKTALENFDINGSLSEINGELIEGTDYEVPLTLAEETFVSDFINSNPLKTVFDSSGFTYNSSSCSTSLDLGYLGVHSLNICALESGFVAFGNLLVAFTTLIGLVHVATGRGF